ncbi:glycoside hydrolase family protein [Pontiella agarivorans]|uniref:Glycoside hydrolase family protein n=1 Tax=Pontiella agarivorans TaxID=3038953 RepID=A0ABU5MSC6_9BACT|nr:glycoside hydrolase family protein [Pontiella agarivorans]MDZ8117033.1 glycoside hydrolase family protein [Pontiella agarivorans]
MKCLIPYLLWSLFLISAGRVIARPNVPRDVESFAEKLIPQKRILNLMDEGWRVWGCAPMYGPEGKVHVFFARWPNKEEGFSEHQWAAEGQIVHAIADHPLGPYKVLDIVIEGRGGDCWDATGVINPQIHKIDGKYVLLYTGARDGDIATQGVGMLTAPSLYGPWKKISDKKALVETSDDPNAFDSMMCNNPALIKTPDGRYFMYYKGRSMADLEKGKAKRRIGLAIADQLEGPYVKYKGNPVYNPSPKNCEDPYVWFEEGTFKMLMADKTVIERHAGIYLESFDGIHWSDPVKGYPSPMTLCGKKQRLETPMLLMKDGHPEYLFCNRGEANDDPVYSGFVFKVERAGGQ